VVRAFLAAVAIVAAFAAAGCGGEDPAPPASPGPPRAAPQPAAAGVTRADVPADCRASVPRKATGPPAVLLNPPGKVAVAGVTGSGGISRVRGYVAMEPGPFLEAFKQRGDVRFLDGENEGFDAELTVQGGSTQVFWKLKKVCDTGSTFTAIVTQASG
jgi:hypothetical protein